MLEPILASVRTRLPSVVERLDELRASAERQPAARPLASALVGDTLRVIAEIKRRSPSRGALAPMLDPVVQAKSYREAGAAAISVLTEPDHFDGSLDDLVAVRGAVDLPVLRKDFMLHPAQVWESRAAGADAILLIVGVLTDDELTGLLATAAEAGVEALVEVHTKPEVDRARAAGARVIGVNNRDLATFEVDLEVAESLRDRIGAVDACIAESGIVDSAAAARMAAAGYDAVLVGEALVTAPDPGFLLDGLRVPR